MVFFLVFIVVKLQVVAPRKDDRRVKRRTAQTEDDSDVIFLYVFLSLNSKHLLNPCCHHHQPIRCIFLLSQKFCIHTSSSNICDVIGNMHLSCIRESPPLYIILSNVG